MTEKHNKVYTCKRLRMLEYLKKNGFTPFNTIPDPTNANYNWWLFENSPAFEKCLKEYFEQLQTRRK